MARPGVTLTYDPFDIRAVSARPLLIVFALLFAGLSVLLAGGALLTANPVLLMAAFPLGLVAGLMFHQGTGGMAAELFGSGSRRRRSYRTPSSRVTGAQRKSADAENSGSRTGGPEAEAFWEEVRREARHRSRRRNRQRRRRRAGDDRARDHGGKSGGGQTDRSNGGTRTRGRHRRNPGVSSTDEPGVAEAYRILDLKPGAGETAVRDAYREKAKRLHPDTEGGDAEAFKRVTAAYERLTE